MSPPALRGKSPTQNPMPKVNVLTNTCLLSIDKSPFYAILRTFSAFSCNFFATLSVNPCCFSFHLMRVCVGAGAGGHGCTGKQKRNSICGVSNSIKSKIWITLKKLCSLCPFCFWFLELPCFVPTAQFTDGRFLGLSVVGWGV